MSLGPRSPALAPGPNPSPYPRLAPRLPRRSSRSGAATASTTACRSCGGWCPAPSRSRSVTPSPFPGCASGCRLLSPGFTPPCPLPQGSAKLEKAEILQMTVDHLKMLHTAGGKGKVRSGGGGRRKGHELHPPAVDVAFGVGSSSSSCLCALREA